MKDIKGFEGLYAITEDGRVWSYPKYRRNVTSYISLGFYLKPLSFKSGYFYVDLYKNGKNKKYRIHRLVAEAFIPNPNNLTEINHKDENKSNNHKNNLEWCSNVYNIHYSKVCFGENKFCSKLKKYQVIEIIKLYKQGFSYIDLSKKYGVHKDTIYSIIKGKTWNYSLTGNKNIK